MSASWASIEVAVSYLRPSALVNWLGSSRNGAANANASSLISSQRAVRAVLSSLVATEASLLLVLETDELRTTVTVGRPARAALKILAVLFEKMLGGTGTNADYAAPQVFQDVSSGRGCYGYVWGW